jgi:hypothetical protein
VACGGAAAEDWRLKKGGKEEHGAADGWRLKRGRKEE